MRIKPFIIILFVIVAVVVLITNVGNQATVETVPNCKVLNLQQQQILGATDREGFSTHYRYLVITDKETFICESSFLNGKFNNSDIFWRLQKDSTYTFKVAGFGKGIITDYRNILEVVNTKSHGTY